MPLGWYLAQGLIPLEPSSSDDEEGPVELPNGRLVCGPHGLVLCGKCCTDYSFMEDVLYDDGGDGISDHFDSDTEAMYWDLDPATRAQVDAKWGPSASRQSENHTSTTVDTDPADEAVVVTTSKSTSLPTNFSEDSFGLKKVKGTGRIFPTRFYPPSNSITPTGLFSGRKTIGRLTRYTYHSDPRKLLIFTDGACLNNGQPNPKAGWAFVHGVDRTGAPSIVSGRLENQGPFGEDGVQSSNRAELRAVIAALRFRNWAGEGFHTMVIATDSEYTAEGSTKWATTWMKNGWKTSGHAAVKNKDLWEILLGEVERHKDAGLTIHFWRIPRGWNTVADEAAKKAAAGDDAPAEWREVFGICL